MVRLLFLTIIPCFDHPWNLKYQHVLNQGHSKFILNYYEYENAR